MFWELGMKGTVVRVDRDEVVLKTVEISRCTTWEEAVQEAGWTGGNNQKLALWNVLTDPQTKISEGDRIEILPALTVDPMTARRLREEKNQKPENVLIRGRNGGKHRLL